MMDLFTFPDPSRDTIDTLKAGSALWPTATVSTSHPTTLSAPHLQVAWDGTPSDEAQREFTAIRVTAWAPQGRGTDANALAALARAYLLDSGSDVVWRYTRGLGRAPGVDATTGLPFCTFTLTAETKPSPAA